MAEKELRRMSREELVEIIYALQQNQQTLEEQNRDLQAKLDERTLRCQNAGSLAEAALSLNHVFESAQAAADQYLASVRAEEEEARARAEEITAQAKQQADKLLDDARTEADNITAQAKQDADRQWDIFRSKVRAAVDVSPELAALLQSRSHTANPE